MTFFKSYGILLVSTLCSLVTLTFDLYAVLVVLHSYNIITKFKNRIAVHNHSLVTVHLMPELLENFLTYNTLCLKKVPTFKIFVTLSHLN